MMKNENGRSMIEMLGVLAIIGVLSVGGIYGYTLAMRKYKANEIAQTASMLATIAKTAKGGVGEAMTVSAAGLPTVVAGIDVNDMEATPSGDDPAAVTLPAAVTGELKTTLCNIVPTDASDDSAKAAGYYFSDCPSA